MKEFSDFVDAGRELMQKRDDHSWELGDLAVEFEVSVGRPSEPGAQKLGDLAHAWNVDTPRVSEWRNVAKFYAKNVRTFEDLTWGTTTRPAGPATMTSTTRWSCCPTHSACTWGYVPSTAT